MRHHHQRTPPGPSTELSILPAPDEATGATASEPDDDVAVLGASPDQRKRRAQSKSDAYAAVTTPTCPLDAHAAPLERTLDVGRVLSRQRRAVLGENPVVAASKLRVLTTLAIVSLCFFTVCGGPAGTEPAVAAGGPLLALVGYAVLPLVFNLPITFAIAELCTAFPEDGGFAMWVLTAFGPFWGFLEGYWAWVRSVFDRVLYVQVIYWYVFDTLGVTVSSKIVEYIVKAAIAIVLTLPSLLGVRLVTFVLSSLLVVVVGLFVVFSLWGIAGTGSIGQFGDIRRTSIVLSSDEAGAATLSGSWDVDWWVYLNSLFWSFDGFYLASVFGGEVSNPARTYPRAFFFSFALMWLVYVLPMVAAVGVNKPHWSTWEDFDYVDTIAFEIGRSTLHAVVLVGVIVGVAVMYMAELFCEAYQISGMAECGLAPVVFKARDARFAMPRASIAFSLAVVVVALAFDVSAVLEVGNAFSAIVELFIIASAIKLRKTLPFVPRSTKVPGGTGVLCLVLLLPTILLASLLVKTLLNPTSVLVFAIVTCVGAVCGVWQRHQLHRQAGV